MTDMKELGFELTKYLDAAMPLLEAEARREKAREAGKPLRNITHQQRAENAKKLIAKAAPVFGFDL